MADEDLCPTCHSFIAEDAADDRQVQGESDPGDTVNIIDSSGDPIIARTSTSRAIPQWTNDPSLTTDGFNGEDFKGEDVNKLIWFVELQNARIAEEEEAGLSTELKTVFSPLVVGETIPAEKHVVELRESTEKILNSIGTTLEDYFKRDIDENEIEQGPNDLENKNEWSSIDRGKAYLTNDGTFKTTFELPDGTERPVPSVPDDTILRAVLLEDLRHPLVLGWREFWSVTVPKIYFNSPPDGQVIEDTPSSENLRVFPLTNDSGNSPVANSSDIHPSDGGMQLTLYDNEKTWLIAGTSNKQTSPNSSASGNSSATIKPSTDAAALGINPDANALVLSSNADAAASGGAAASFSGGQSESMHRWKINPFGDRFAFITGVVPPLFTEDFTERNIKISARTRFLATIKVTLDQSGNVNPSTGEEVPINSLPALQANAFVQLVVEFPDNPELGLNGTIVITASFHDNPDVNPESTSDDPLLTENTLPWSRSFTIGTKTYTMDINIDKALTDSVLNYNPQEIDDPENGGKIPNPNATKVLFRRFLASVKSAAQGISNNFFDIPSNATAIIELDALQIVNTEREA